MRRTVVAIDTGAARAATWLYLTVTLVAALVAALLLSSAAHATTGRDAVGMCIDSTASGARCVWSVNPKGEIDICNKNGCVTCPSANGTCEVTIHRTRPTRPLPSGVVVDTAIGNFTVAPKQPFNFAPRCYRGEMKCPLMGCVPIGKCDLQRSTKEN